MDRNEKDIIENLLISRYKVIALYPNCPFMMGQVLISEPYGSGIKLRTRGVNARTLSPSSVYLSNERFPHLFEELNWWMDRTPEELPLYVKLNWNERYKETRDSSMVYKVTPFWEGDENNEEMVGIGQNFAHVLIREGDFEKPTGHTNDGRPTISKRLYELLPATEEEYIADGERIKRLRNIVK